MLILVRHGRTALNAAGKLQGRIDEPLDEVGEAQAVAVAAFVGSVDELISSPLLRAQQTARAFGLPFEIDERWIELAYGIYEGMPHADVPSEVWDHWRVDPGFVPEGGESLRALDRRVRAACADLSERATGSRRGGRQPRVADQDGSGLGARRRHRDRVAVTPVAGVGVPHRHPRPWSRALLVQRAPGLRTPACRSSLRTATAPFGCARRPSRRDG